MRAVSSVFHPGRERGKGRYLVITGEGISKALEGSSNMEIWARAAERCWPAKLAESLRPEASWERRKTRASDVSIMYVLV